MSDPNEKPLTPPKPTPESIIADEAPVNSVEAMPNAPKTSSWLGLHRKAVLITTSVVVVIFASGAFAWSHLRSKPSPVATVATPSPTPTPSPSPTTKLSPLTGLPVALSLANRPITGVVIENHPDARPQSGLQDAGVVYEANAEGGITRFEAFFLDNLPTVLGPVRSVRTYFVDWALEFNAPLAHAGGNADALDLIKPLGMKDMNALSFAAEAFYRDNRRNVASEHTLYTSTAKLDALESRLGYAQPSSFTASPRKADTPSASPPHPNVHINFSYTGYQVDYTYDPTTNDYARNLAGTPHIDNNTGKQIHVKNIVIEMMPTSYGTTRLGESTVIMQTVGKGQGWVLSDGNATAVTWSKDSHAARTKLLDASSKDLPLDAGNTWYEIVPVGNTVSF
jgi:hypothetical protein